MKNSNSLKDMKMDVAASLWIEPCTFDELFKRSVIKNISEYAFNTVVKMAKASGYIYERGEILYCYKKTVKQILNPEGYELELPDDTRSALRKEFDRINNGK